MPKYKSLSQAISDNSSKLCKVKGCSRRRHRISGYCAPHSTINNVFGSPYHKKLLANHYSIERQEVRELVELNLLHSHSGILWAIDWLDKWLSDAYDDKPHVVSKDHFRRLKDAGVTGKDILIECCALYLYHVRRPDRIVTDRHLIYCLGSRVIRLSPYWGKTSGPEHRKVGERLKQTIGPLLVSVSWAIEKRERADNQRLKALGQPLRTT